MNEISYNRERFNEVCKECNLTPYRIWKDIHTGNQITPRRWIDGGDIPVSRLIDFCNFYHIDILSFFLLHEERLDDAMKELNSTQEERGSDSFADERINHVKEISELEKTHIKELAEKEHTYQTVNYRRDAGKGLCGILDDADQLLVFRVFRQVDRSAYAQGEHHHKAGDDDIDRV